MVGVSGSAVDVDAVKTTIGQALVQRSALPRYEELCALHRDLLKHIDTLMPFTRNHIDGLWHGSAEWYKKRTQLNFVPHQVGTGLGCGLQSAAWHVKSLGYTLRFLWENSGLPGSREGLAP